MPQQLTIITNALSFSRHRLEILTPVDETRLAYYTDIVVQVWQKATEYLVATGARHDAKPNVDCITLAVLYFLQTGYRPRGHELLPHDEYLCTHLPRSSDLHALGIDKRLDTIGTKLITEMYETAISDHADDSRLYLRYDTELGKQTLVVNGHSQSTAEKLFTPTSRRKHT